MPDCRQVTERATDLLEGRLGPAEALLLWLHLAYCRYCREYLRQIRRTIGLLGMLGASSEGTAPDAASVAGEALKEWKKGAG